MFSVLHNVLHSNSPATCQSHTVRNNKLWDLAVLLKDDDGFFYYVLGFLFLEYFSI